VMCFRFGGCRPSSNKPPQGPQKRAGKSFENLRSEKKGLIFVGQNPPTGEKKAELRRKPARGIVRGGITGRGNDKDLEKRGGHETGSNLRGCRGRHRGQKREKKTSQAGEGRVRERKFRRNDMIESKGKANRFRGTRAFDKGRNRGEGRSPRKRLVARVGTDI